MDIALFSRADVTSTAPMEALVAAVREAFVAYARDRAVMPAKTYVELPVHDGDFRAMPAYVDATAWEAAGLKWVNVHPNNPDEHGLPTVMGIMIYSDPATGRPLAVLDGTELTRRRTGAAAAVATDVLAEPDATSLGLVGAGAQADAQLEAIRTVRGLTEVVVADADPSAARAFVERHDGELSVRTGDVAAAAACDVLSTITPVREPIVSASDLGPDTHVNAIGADAPGKQELDPAILEAATLIVDDWEQCVHSGEINVPIRDGIISESSIDGTLGEVLTGAVPGRSTDGGPTVFDTTGLAIQDVAAAYVCYERRDGIGDRVDLLDLD